MNDSTDAHFTNSVSPKQRSIALWIAGAIVLVWLSLVVFVTQCRWSISGNDTFVYLINDCSGEMYWVYREKAVKVEKHN